MNGRRLSVTTDHAGCPGILSSPCKQVPTASRCSVGSFDQRRCCCSAHHEMERCPVKGRSTQTARLLQRTSVQWRTPTNMDEDDFH
eukprot:1133717-Pelagomonas_calceolata.AAC.2